MKIWAIMAAAFALLVGAPAAAAERSCHGEASAGGASMHVIIETSASREIRRWAVWTLATDAGSKDTPLQLAYSLNGERLGELREVSVLTNVNADPRPKSTSATIVVRVDGRVWTRPGPNFSELLAPDPKTRAEPMFSVVNTQMAFAGSDDEPSFNADLLSSLGAARQIEVEVRGDAGEVFATGAYTRPDYDGRDALFRQALTAARVSARTPNTCFKMPRR